MLKRNFKHEEQRAINRLLHGGLQLSFVPEIWELKEKQRVDEILRQTIGLTTNSLFDLSPKSLGEQLKASDFGLTNYEHFADLLLKLVSVYPGNREELVRKALYLYDFAQKENNTFSFGVDAKIAKAKNLLA